MVEDSVRWAATRVRINAQLIDARDNTHLWADRFNRDLADIFALHEIVGSIVGALAHVLRSANSVAGGRASNLDSYELFVRGRAFVTQSIEGNRAAPALFERSIELDPNFAQAHAWLAMSRHRVGVLV